ncbi:MAG: hypothetical protein ACYC4L_14835 [Chloroflexota bacterium]
MVSILNALAGLSGRTRNRRAYGDDVKTSPWKLLRYDLTHPA